jgi:hypothetical protein
LADRAATLDRAHEAQPPVRCIGAGITRLPLVSTIMVESQACDAAQQAAQLSRPD